MRSKKLKTAAGVTTQLCEQGEVRASAPSATSLGLVVWVAGTVTVSGTVTVLQGTSPWIVQEVGTAGTWTNGAQTAVSNAAVSVLAANANRKSAMIQNVGNYTVRVGVSGVTNVTGYQLVRGATLILNMPFCPVQGIYAIREGADDSTVYATEVT